MDNLLNMQMNQALLATQSHEGPDVAGVRTEEQARAVAEEFEGFFIGQMLEAMFKGVGESNPFGGGSGEKAFRGLLHEEYAKVMAESGGIGLSDKLTTEILRLQEAGGN